MLAGFVITYERPAILATTIEAIFIQTMQPQKLLIIDNSITNGTRSLIDRYYSNDPRIEYYRVGFNSGPAGGAYFGLKILAEQKWDYIQWYDDDNPPLQSNITEKLFNLVTSDELIAAAGQAGAQFSRVTGHLSRYSDSELQSSRYLEVDYIGGNQLMIVRADVVRKGCLPDKDLFFGFEDLSFCLKVRAMGFRIVIDSQLLLDIRKSIKRTGSVELSNEPSWRDYYSIRSLVYICLHEQKLIVPLFSIFATALIAAFRKKRFRFLPLLGFFHGILGRKGIVVPPIAKKSGRE